MTTLRALYLYPALATVFFGMDMLWLGVIAKSFYDKQLGSFRAPQVNWGAAFLFYAIFLAGIEVFVVLPGIEKGSLARTCLMGVFFGIVSYSAFDLTCWAMFKDWPAIVTWVDLIWGGFITGLVSLVGYVLAFRFLIGK